MPGKNPNFMTNFKHLRTVTTADATTMAAITTIEEYINMIVPSDVQEEKTSGKTQIIRGYDSMVAFAAILTGNVIGCTAEIYVDASYPNHNLGTNVWCRVYSGDLVGSSVVSSRFIPPTAQVKILITSITGGGAVGDSVVLTYCRTE